MNAVSEVAYQGCSKILEALRNPGPIRSDGEWKACGIGEQYMGTVQLLGNRDQTALADKVRHLVSNHLAGSPRIAAVTYGVTLEVIANMGRAPLHEALLLVQKHLPTTNLSSFEAQRLQRLGGDLGNAARFAIYS